MKRIFLILAAMAVISTASASDVVNFVEVTGKGEVKVIPNEFTLSIVVDEGATKGRYSVDEVENQMVAALKKIGVEKNALTISGMSSLMQKRKDLTKATYELKLNSVEQITECYDAFEGLGITNIQISKATNSDMGKYQSEARIAAVKDARLRATELGKALGQKVGECFEMLDRSSYANERVYMNYMTRAQAADSFAEEPLEFRDITVTYNVDAKFILELSESAQDMIVD